MGGGQRVCSTHRPVDNQMWLVLNRQTLWIMTGVRFAVRTVGADG